MRTFDDLKKMPANDLKAIGFKPEVCVRNLQPVVPDFWPRQVLEQSA